MVNKVIGKHADALSKQLVPITDLYLDPANARKHPEKNMEAIKNSLKRFGQDQLIIAAMDGRVIVGNGRLEAAKALGWTHVACIKVPLDKADAVARAIADNRTGELAEWDTEVLSRDLEALMEEGFDLDELGWDADDLKFLLSKEFEPSDEEQPRLDEKAKVTCPSCGYEF